MDDLCSMNLLHEAPLLHCLMRRFFQDKIYTMTGDVLIAVNPYKLIPNLYGNPLMHLDIPGSQGQEDVDDDQDAAASAPHVYKIANSALVNLFKGQLDSQDGEWKVKNQSIVVSGESGAVRHLPLTRCSDVLLKRSDYPLSLCVWVYVCM